MILALWNDRIFLASKARPDTPSCALVAGDWQGLEELGFQCEERNCVGGIFRRWHRFMPTMHGITFYPEIRYRGFRVYPQAWHYESSEPLLHCYMDHSDISGGGWEETKERMSALIEDGWAWDQRDGGNKYIHVDDLEKIEGPPPEGAF